MVLDLLRGYKRIHSMLFHRQFLLCLMFFQVVAVLFKVILFFSLPKHKKIDVFCNVLYEHVLQFLSYKIAIPRLFFEL